MRNHLRCFQFSCEPGRELHSAEHRLQGLLAISDKVRKEKGIIAECRSCHSLCAIRASATCATVSIASSTQRRGSQTSIHAAVSKLKCLWQRTYWVSPAIVLWLWVVGHTSIFYRSLLARKQGVTAVGELHDGLQLFWLQVQQSCCTCKPFNPFLLLGSREVAWTHHLLSHRVYMGELHALHAFQRGLWFHTQSWIPTDITQEHLRKLVRAEKGFGPARLERRGCVCRGEGRNSEIQCSMYAVQWRTVYLAVYCLVCRDAPHYCT